MKTFLRSEEKKAVAHAIDGGQALHLRDDNAALYDQNLPRLVETARRLGLVAVQVARTCTDRQHVVLGPVALLRAVTIPASERQEHQLIEVPA